MGKPLNSGKMNKFKLINRLLLPGGGVLECKLQGSTLDTAVVDLDPQARSQKRVGSTCHTISHSGGVERSQKIRRSAVFLSHVIAVACDTF